MAGPIKPANKPAGWPSEPAQAARLIWKCCSPYITALISSPPSSFLTAVLFFLLFSFRLPYAGYFGGVSGLSKKQFLKINGFPNEYWGWGGEDDDIYNR